MPLWLVKTDDSLGIAILRMVVGIVMFAHGAQKLLGWFGGQGFSGTIGFLTTQLGIPWMLAFLVIIGESIGSLSLLIGFLTRFVAASYILIMLGAIAMVHWPNGFFMNWFGQQQGEGFEYHLLVIGMSLALLIEGGGRWSGDQLIAKRIARPGWAGTHG